MMRASAMLLFLASVANAECPNACSGHGTCGTDDVCTCFQNWQSGDEASGDCSDRTCPYDIAWADLPTGDNTAHAYQECSGRGLCDRKTGECDCFDGYTGAACKRTTCPNDCSGHGTCEFISDVFPTTENGVQVHLTHDLLGKMWDSDKSRMCVCDPKYTDVDCSRKMCPKGNDPLDDCSQSTGTKYAADANLQIQHICLYGATAGEFAIKYNDYYNGEYTTSAIAFDADAETVMDALLSLPDHAIDQVNVEHTITSQYCDKGGSMPVSGWFITFLAHQTTGKQHILELMEQPCLDGCQPLTAGLTLDANDGFTSVTIEQASETNMYECSRRGKCDYDAGVCECFDGFTDEDCSVQSSLA